MSFSHYLGICFILLMFLTVRNLILICYNILKWVWFNNVLLKAYAVFTHAYCVFHFEFKYCEISKFIRFKFKSILRLHCQWKLLSQMSEMYIYFKAVLFLNASFLLTLEDVWLVYAKYIIRFVCLKCLESLISHQALFLSWY